MDKVQNSKPTPISIKLPISVRQLRALTCDKQTDDLQVSEASLNSASSLFHVKLAQKVSTWTSIKKIGIWCTATRAAVRQLLTLQDLEDLYVTSLNRHGTLTGMPISASLHTLRAGRLSSADLRSIAKLPNLKVLSAQNADLSDEALESLICMSHLADLDLEATNLDDEMAATLATSKTLTSLCIGNTNVGPEGLQHICKMTQLRELDMWALDIQASDLDMLTALPNLEYLSVGGHDEQTVLTAQAVLPKVAQLPSLKRLWLDGIPLSETETAELTERYDHVQVT